MIYEELLPANHLLCKPTTAVALSFVSGTVGDWSLAGATMQVPITAIVANCKKMAKLLSGGLCPRH